MGSGEYVSLCYFLWGFYQLVAACWDGSAHWVAMDISLSGLILVMLPTNFEGSSSQAHLFAMSLKLMAFVVCIIIIIIAFFF